MGYCDRGLVRVKYGADNIDGWADLDNDKDQTKIDARIDDAIAEAYDFINDRLRASAFTIPPVEVPSAFEHMNALLAGCLLYEARGVDSYDESTNQPQHRYAWQRKRVEQWIKDVRSGAIDLGLPSTALSYPVVVKD